MTSWEEEYTNLKNAKSITTEINLEIFVGTLDHPASEGFNLVFRLWIFEVDNYNSGALYESRFLT